ncbi:AraC family transcriptional regulator [Paludifilum halophilum]|uniref:AraC family transcriptional regulator n=1 Tax=Paludifilum halophilum TaxID=1642702 RepID=A0A235B4L6_9BACL|nr:AraC family transcriptional regulator [Paludifilum halophilum]OYD07172.1 AraC family transcriptional regulator [Paludifilum halophilum]
MRDRETDLSIQGIKLYENKHKEKHRIKSHYHQTHQILYVLEGRGRCTLDRKPYNFSRDNMAVIAPYSNHSIFADSKMTVLVLEFDESVLSRSVREELVSIVFRSSRVIPISLFDSSELRQLLRKMLYQQSQGESINFLAMRIFLAEMLFVLVRSQQMSQVMDTNALRAEWLRNYMHTHYFEIGGSNDLANKMGMSVRYVHRIFKEHYRKTPMQYLTEVRMERAKKMLIETDNDVVSICFEVGFESVSTFYRVFKKHVGIPPNRYRTSHRELDKK